MNENSNRHARCLTTTCPAQHSHNSRLRHAQHPNFSHDYDNPYDRRANVSVAQALEHIEDPTLRQVMANQAVRDGIERRNHFRYLDGYLRMGPDEVPPLLASLAGIEMFPRLRDVALARAQFNLGDLSPLGLLPELKHLSIEWGAEGSTIAHETLPVLPQLEGLSLRSTGLERIELLLPLLSAVPTPGALDLRIGGNPLDAAELLLLRPYLDRLNSLDVYSIGEPHNQDSPFTLLQDLEFLQSNDTITRLEVSSNPELVDISGLSRLSALRELEVGSTGIDPVPELTALPQRSQITQLGLGWTRDLTTEDLLSIVSAFPQLDALNIGGTEVAELSLLFQARPSLRHLDVREIHRSVDPGDGSNWEREYLLESIRGIAALTGLEVLRAHGNPNLSLGVDELASLPELRYLNLDGCVSVPPAHINAVIEAWRARGSYGSLWRPDGTYIRFDRGTETVTPPR